jgi:hypothetical protein
MARVDDAMTELVACPTNDAARTYLATLSMPLLRGLADLSHADEGTHGWEYMTRKQLIRVVIDAAREGMDDVVPVVEAPVAQAEKPAEEPRMMGGYLVLTYGSWGWGETLSEAKERHSANFGKRNGKWLVFVFPAGTEFQGVDRSGMIYFNGEPPTQHNGRTFREPANGSA